MLVATIYYWNDVETLERFGYVGAFIISFFGGATILAPVPMTPAIFALGAALRPTFAPYLGPVFVGMAGGLGEALGSMVIYITGYSGGAAYNVSKEGKLPGFYRRVLRWVEKRGSLMLFLLSAVLNPFFYPAAVAAGASHFAVKKYFLICWAGKTIKAIGVAMLGYWGLGGLLRLMGIAV